MTSRSDTEPQSHTDTTTPTGAPAARLKLAFFRALPWLVACISFIALNHAADTQTLVTRLAAGDPDATSTAQWLYLLPPTACAAGLFTAYFTSIRNRLLAATGALIVPLLLAALSPAALLPLLLVAPALMVADFIAAGKSLQNIRQSFFHGTLLTFLLAYAAYTRQELLYQVINNPTDPDFAGYLQYAQESTGYATMFREPFFIWILQVVGFLGGEITPIMQRLTSVAMGVGAVASIFYLCLRHLNVIVAVIAAGLYAGQEYLVYTATRGLREDSIVLTTILFIAISWHHLRGPVTWRSLTLWGLMGAACSLLRISSFSFVIAVVFGTAFYRFIRDIKPWPLRARWALPIVLTAGLMAPYLVHVQQQYGDPFFVVKFHVRFYANQEFGGKHPDFPTREEIAKDSYAGAPMSGSEYVFGYHDMPEIIQRTWRGFEKTFFMENLNVAFNVSNESGAKNLLSILNIIGVILLLFPRHLYLVLCMFLFHGPLLFLASFPYFDPRLMIVAMVFIFIAVGSAFGLTASYAWRFLRADNGETRTYGNTSKPPARRRDSRRGTNPGHNKL